MGFLAALKSGPAIIGMLGAAALGIYILFLLNDISDLEERVKNEIAARATCEAQKAAVAANRDSLIADVKDQNERIERQNATLEAAERDLAEMARSSAEEQDRLQAKLTERLEAIQSRAPPETVEQQLEQCRRAHGYLVREQ